MNSSIKNIIYFEILFKKYKIMKKFSQGSFGIAYKLLEEQTGIIFAAKPFRKPTNSAQIIKNIKHLQILDHENVMKLIAVCVGAEGGVVSGTYFYMIFEYCEYDLGGIIRSGKNIHMSEIKNIMKQLFAALYYIHCNGIFHRDLKTDNIFLNKEGVVKLADFGLVKPLTPDGYNCETTVNSLWYRAPEFLLGETNYKSSMDIWGAGCILAEFWTKSAIMQGASVVEQLSLITKMCGSITADVWPNVTKLAHFNLIENFPAYVNQTLKAGLVSVVTNDEAMDLLERLLVLNPAKRLDANKVFYHNLFFKEPFPSDNLARLMSGVKEEVEQVEDRV